MSKSAKKSVHTMSEKDRSNAARKAAANAWKFMHSKAYQSIRNSNRTPKQKRAAIEALKARRAA